MVLYLLAGMVQVFATSLTDASSACKNGDGGSCLFIGALYYTGKEIKQDLNMAKVYYIKACELKVAAGCTELGNLFYTGEGVKQDDKEAIRYYMQACELDGSLGCRYLGDQYNLGQGVEQNITTAGHFYHKACILGDSEGCKQDKLIKKNHTINPSRNTSVKLQGKESTFTSKMKQYKNLKKERDQLIQEAELLDKL